MFAFAFNLHLHCITVLHYIETSNWCASKDLETYGVTYQSKLVEHVGFTVVSDALNPSPGCAVAELTIERHLFNSLVWKW